MQRLRFVSELPERYRQVFSEFTVFNFIQSSIMDFLMQSDMSVVVSAPTGSGKTTLFEIAIIRLLEIWEHSGDDYNKEQKIVYMAPIKALCTERFKEWEDKFTSLGIRAIEITGDSDGSDLVMIQHFNLILTTPEKWDALTRRWKDHSKLIQMIKLFLIDEVHLLNEDRRGPTLEAVVSRMKTVQESIDCKNDTNPWIRFIAVSATIPNIEDIAQWLSLKQRSAKFFKFGEEMRPVHLKRIVKSYPANNEPSSGYKFDLYLNYKLKQIIMQYSEGKPTLVFCSTRKSVLTTVNILSQQISYRFTGEQEENIRIAADYLMDAKLKEMVKLGLAYHHAGLAVSDRHCIEELFRSGYLPILVSTSTLAMGVNLPASLVIIKSTEQYVCGGWQEYSEGQILQMVGRAGRPQFSDSATAIILTKDANQDKYEKLVHGREMVESSLHRHLVEYLNAEIVLGTITDIAVAMNWIRSTYLYVRALKNPKHYGIPVGFSSKEVEARLQDMCLRELHALENFELVVTSDLAYNVEPTENGKLMAKYYIAFETMKIFMKVKGTENLSEMLDLVSECHEFEDMKLRTSEKSLLNMLNSSKEREFIRFPLEGKIKTRKMKTNCLIQAVLGSIQITDPSLRQESVKIIRLAQRLLNGLSIYLWQKNCYQALVSTLILNKCVHAKLWENSTLISRQLPGIGALHGSQLAAAYKTTFQSILETNPRDLERIINRKPPMGNQIREAAAKIPQYELKVAFNYNERKLTILMKILNAFDVQYGNTLHRCYLLLADMDNQVLKKEKICDQAILAHGGEFKFVVNVRNQKSFTEFILHLISETLVGVDVKHHYQVVDGQAVRQSSFNDKVDTVQPKVNSKGKENKAPRSRTKKQANAKAKSPRNTVRKQIQSYLDKYNFVPKKSFYHQRLKNNNEHEDNEVSSTQDLAGTSKYFSADYYQEQTLTGKASAYNDKDKEEEDIYSISDTDDCNADHCTDSGIGSITRSSAYSSGSTAVQQPIRAANQPNEGAQIINQGEHHAAISASQQNFVRRPILISPNATTTDIEQPEKKFPLVKKCFYPIFMPVSNQSSAHGEEASGCTDSFTVNNVESVEKHNYTSSNGTKSTHLECSIDESCEQQGIDTKIKSDIKGNPAGKSGEENIISEETKEEFSKKETFDDIQLSGESISGWSIAGSLLGGVDDLSGDEVEDLYDNDGHNLKPTASKEVLSVENDGKQRESKLCGNTVADQENENRVNSFFSTKGNSKPVVNKERFPLRNHKEQAMRSFGDIAIEEDDVGNHKENLEATEVDGTQGNSRTVLGPKNDVCLKPRAAEPCRVQVDGGNHSSINEKLQRGSKFIEKISPPQKSGFDVDELLQDSSSNSEEMKQITSLLNSSSSSGDNEFPELKGDEKSPPATASIFQLSNFNETQNFQAQHVDVFNKTQRMPATRQNLLEKCQNAFKMKAPGQSFLESNSEIEDNLPPGLQVWPPKRLLHKIPQFNTSTSDLPAVNRLSQRRSNEKPLMFMKVSDHQQARENSEKQRYDQCMNSLRDQNNGLRGAYGDPFAPIYPSSTLNKMAENVNEPDEGVDVLSDEKLAKGTMVCSPRKLNTQRQEHIQDPTACSSSISSPTPSTSFEHHRASTLKQFQNPTSRFHSQRYFQSNQQQFSCRSSTDQMVKPPLRKSFDHQSQSSSALFRPIDKFNRSDQPYFKKIRPRCQLKPNFGNTIRSQCGFNVDVNHCRPSINRNAYQNNLPSCAPKNFNSYSQILPGQAFHGNRQSSPPPEYDTSSPPLHSIQGHAYGRSAAPPKQQAHYLMPESFTCPQMMPTMSTDDRLSSSQYYEMMQSHPTYGFDPNQYYQSEFERRNDHHNFMNFDYNEMSHAGPASSQRRLAEFESSFFVPVEQDVHQMSPSPPMSGDEFQELMSNQATHSPGSSPDSPDYQSAHRCNDDVFF